MQLQNKDANPANIVAWPVPTRVLLLLTGAILSLSSFLVVANMPDLVWHPARDAELQATYSAYLETGTLLVKASGSGSNYTQAPSPGPWTSAAWDDDPAVYIAASVLGRIAGSGSPYLGLKYLQAFLVALPLFFLPIALGRFFGRARAGYALLLVPPTIWLVNKGTILLGTEYGLFDNVATLRVYSLYGISASLIFLSLCVILLISSFNLTYKKLIFATISLGLFAGILNLSRALSGVSTILAIGVLWWINTKGRLKFVFPAMGILTAAIAAFTLQSAVMKQINLDRAHITGQSLADLPNAHGTWHPLYLGLAYPQPITGEPSKFDVVWSDEFAWQKVWQVNPEALIASNEYDLIVKEFFLDEVKEKPLQVGILYFEKLLFVVKQFGAMLVLILLATLIACYRKGPHRRAVAIGFGIAAPALFMGLIPPVLVMPMLYYYSELSAALGLLVAIAIGAIVWSITSLPAYVRSQENLRLIERGLSYTEPKNEISNLAVVVPCRNGADIIGETICKLSELLPQDSEIVVVENGSTDDTWHVLSNIKESWTAKQKLNILRSTPGLGNALRTGVLATSAARILMTADDLPFGDTDFIEFQKLEHSTLIAVGSKAHPDSKVPRSKGRKFQSRIFRFIREAILQTKVGDSQGTLWVDGNWGRSFALFSREESLMWTTELILAAEQQKFEVVEVPVVLQESHKSVTSRFGLRDAFKAMTGFIRLAIYKDDYANAIWEPSNKSLS